MWSMNRQHQHVLEFVRKTKVAMESTLAERRPQVACLINVRDTLSDCITGNNF